MAACITCWGKGVWLLSSPLINTLWYTMNGCAAATLPLPHFVWASLQRLTWDRKELCEASTLSWSHDPETWFTVQFLPANLLINRLKIDYKTCLHASTCRRTHTLHVIKMLFLKSCSVWLQTLLVRLCIVNNELARMYIRMTVYVVRNELLLKISISLISPCYDFYFKHPKWRVSRWQRQSLHARLKELFRSNIFIMSMSVCVCIRFRVSTFYISFSDGLLKVLHEVIRE